MKAFIDELLKWHSGKITPGILILAQCVFAEWGACRFIARRLWWGLFGETPQNEKQPPPIHPSPLQIMGIVCDDHGCGIMGIVTRNTNTPIPESWAL